MPSMEQLKIMNLCDTHVCRACHGEEESVEHKSVEDLKTEGNDSLEYCMDMDN